MEFEKPSKRPRFTARRDTAFGGENENNTQDNVDRTYRPSNAENNSSERNNNYSSPNNQSGYQSFERPTRRPAEAGSFERPSRSQYNNSDENYERPGGYNNNNNSYSGGNQGGGRPRPGGYQQRNNYQGGGGGGYQQRNNYSQGEGTSQGGGNSYQDGARPRPGGYQQRNNYQGGGGGYQQRNNYGSNNSESNEYGNNAGAGYRQGAGYPGQEQHGGGGGYNNNNGYRPYNNNKPRPNYRQDQQGYNRKPMVKNGFKTKFRAPQPVEYTEVLPTLDQPIRLNKFLSNAGVCSRRDADTHIQEGKVTVNGIIVKELGTKVTRMDDIRHDGKSVDLERKVYVLLNKPKDCVTTMDDPEARTTVMKLLGNACQERIFPVGRLDRNTTGVLLLTNDGDLASKLTHPKFLKKKVYHVGLDKDISIEDIQKIAEGIELEDGLIQADAIGFVDEEDQKQVGIEIHSGKNRIVRRIFEHLGYKVYKLDRVLFAGLSKKGLGRGKWRHLTQEEVNMLKMGAFE